MCRVETGAGAGPACGRKRRVPWSKTLEQLQKEHGPEKGLRCYNYNQKQKAARERRVQESRKVSIDAVGCLCLLILMQSVSIGQLCISEIQH